MTTSAIPDNAAPSTIMAYLRRLFSVLIPPLGVYLKDGVGRSFWLNVVLTLLAYLPGVVHVIWLLRRR